LINNLNQDLADELGAIIQYTTYAAKVTGPYRPQLSAFFLEEVADEQLHAQFLANKIVALGGEPTTTPSPVAAANSNKEMLEAVYAAEKRRPWPTMAGGLKKHQLLATKGWPFSLKTWSAMKRLTWKRHAAFCRTGRFRQ
jgi:hypothetical protein